MVKHMQGRATVRCVFPCDLCVCVFLRVSSITSERAVQVEIKNQCLPACEIKAISVNMKGSAASTLSLLHFILSQALNLAAPAVSANMKRSVLYLFLFTHT